MNSNRKQNLPENGTGREVLIATDRPRDAEVLSTVLSRESVSTTVVSDGQGVLTNLMAADESEKRDVVMVVLDLSLSNIDGRTVLDAIRSSPRLQSLPVVALVDEDDAETAALDPNGTLRRRNSRSEFVRAVESMAQFWLECVTFPPERLNRTGPFDKYD